MQYLDYFIGLHLFIFIGGICVDSLKTMPHVVEYETVTPHKIAQTNSKQQKNPHIIAYSLTIAGQNWTLHLEKNINLIGSNFSVVHYSEHGTEETIPDREAHCYYHGHIVEAEDSSASIGLCAGIKGFVRIGDQLYLIEPLADGETEQQNGTQSSDAEEEWPHAVYNYKHLRRKMRSCSQAKESSFYDHVSRLSVPPQLSRLKSSSHKMVQTGKTRTVEMVLVVDNTEYKKFGRKSVEARMLEVANHLDKLYRPLGVRVMLVGLEMWAYRDQIEVSPDPNVTLERFLTWRQQRLLPRTKHDNAQLITGVDFVGNTVGLAKMKAMCTAESGAVNQDYNSNSIGVASTLAHEMGHNLGLDHDDESCVCSSTRSHDACIMAAKNGALYPEAFSSCSQKQLSRFLEEVNPACLYDTYSTDHIYGGSKCGNAFVEPGEECDCGTVEECTNPCCDASTCTLSAGAKCAEGECCHKCQLKPTGSMCRTRTGECDLAEYCTGFSASCPEDAYTQNGVRCNYDSGYCFNGQCPSREQHCRRLWGPEAHQAPNACYESRHGMCGKLFCSGGWKFPVTSSMKYRTLPNGVVCNEAMMDPKDNYPEDLGMVPTGTKCGNNMVCYDRRCQNISSIAVHGTGMNFAVICASLVTSLTLLLVLIIGCSLWMKRKSRSPKRSFNTSHGQFNTVFQSGNVQGSPRLWPPRINRPTFVESTTTQFSKPVYFVASQPPTGAILPSKAAPAPAMKLPAMPQPSKIQQVVRPSMLSESQTISSNMRPLPPSRPLPPLKSKTPVSNTAMKPR